MTKKELLKKYPEGTKIRLIRMEGEPQMKEGLEGSVSMIDDLPQIHMVWENGSTLALNPECDEFEVIRDKINVVYVPVCSMPMSIEAENSLEGFQKLVDGYIEAVHIFDDDPDAVLICNEEGKLSKKLNRAIRDKNGKVIDVIAGNFFITGGIDENGYFVGLNEEQIGRYMKMFIEPEAFVVKDGEFEVFRCCDVSGYYEQMSSKL